MAKKAQALMADLFLEGEGQMRLLDKSVEQKAIESSKVECLGKTFPNEEARRAYFIEILRQKLKDPEFRKLPGFPLGSDEDILRLSNPPYYTACPNPFMGELIAAHRATDQQVSEIVRPYTDDVSSSKSDVVYTAHSYHTKVPPEAIAKYIRHYTKPGDVILDFFSGSGMTAVACKMADQEIAPQTDRKGYQARLPICIDLAPAATFITSVYAWPDDETNFERKATSLLSEVDKSASALYRPGLDIAQDDLVEYVLWNEALYCPNCQFEILSDKVVKATTSIGSADEFPCPSCRSLVSKAPTRRSGALRLERRHSTVIDIASGLPRKAMRRVPMMAQVRSGTSAKALNRKFAPIRVEARDTYASTISKPNHWFPTDPLIQGERFTQKDTLGSYGITHVHHFYLPRQLKVYSEMWDLASQSATWRERQSLLFFVQSNGLGMTVMNRYQPTQFGKEGGSQVNRQFAGTLYVPSMVAEVAPSYAYSNKLNRLTKAFSLLRNYRSSEAIISTQSSTALANIPDASVDYIFVDPPFGRVLQYSELNQVWESWLRVKTDREPEAIMDSSRKRETSEYSALMRAAFKEGFRVLKPGKWVTIEFHNSSNVVWHAIQEALFSSGFIVADVRVLHKGPGTYKQSRQGLMSQDLIISAYKPTDTQETVRSLSSASDGDVWQFVREHLSRLPEPKLVNGVLEPITERQARVLYDRMVAFFVQRQISVPMSAPEFYDGLTQRLPSRDDMVFLEEQAANYDQERYHATQVRQFELFIEDEVSAIEWLRQALSRKPQKMSDIQPQFMREMSAWPKHENPLELEELLAANFIEYDGKRSVPEQIHKYLSSNSPEYRKLEAGSPKLRSAATGRWYVPDPARQLDLEKLREKELLSEFNTYKTSSERKLKRFRSEAVRVGFKAAYDAKDYKTILTLAAKLPEDVVQED